MPLIAAAVSVGLLAPQSLAATATHTSAPSHGPAHAAAAVSPTILSQPFVKGSIVDLVEWGPQARPRIASELKHVGANWDRVAINWSQVEPSKGKFRWGHMDQMVRIANRYGVHLLPVLGYAPTWTNPEDARGYAQFVAAAVRRYGPGTRANLTWFELWNEPTYAYSWSGKEAEPMAYARDVRAASAAAKSVSPSVKVLMYADYEDAPQKGTTPWQLSMIDDYFKAVPDLAHWIDGIAVHPVQR